MRSHRQSFRCCAPRAVLAALVCAGAGVAGAAPGSPELQSLLPAGIQRGTAATVTIRGARLKAAQELLIAGSGLTVSKLANVDDNTVTIELAAAADCTLGEHLVRLRTEGGLTDVSSVWVGALPLVQEAEPNGDFAAPQKIALNSTVAGIVANEDVDWYAVEVKAGQRITAEIEGLRLGRSLFDPAIAILDSKRFELAVSDDAPLAGQDAVASVVAPADGVYVVQVREASYGGNEAAHYRLHVGTMPRPAAVWPPGGKPGETVRVSWLGDPAGVAAADVQLPANPGPVPVRAADDQGIAPTPNWLAVSDLPGHAEPEKPTPDAAPPAAPAAFHGVLRGPGEVDAHRFTAKKGEVFDVRVLARRLKAPADAVVDVFNGTGQHLAGNDDQAGADPELRFTTPDDGVYEARVRDHRGRGGPTFVYRLEIDRVRPEIAAAIERVDARRPQFLQGVAVPRGGRMAVMMRAERKDCGGVAAFEFEGLPAGVGVKAEPVPAELGAAPVVFEAAADAAFAGTLIPVRVKLGDGPSGVFRQTLPLVIGPPNDTVFYQTSIDRMALAVTQPAPFRVSLVAPTAPLLRVGQKAIKVKVEREAGFAAPVTVHMLWNPPGVSSAGAITIAPDQTEAAYPLNASGDAPVKSWKIAVLAHAPVEGGDVWISSDLVDLAVAEPLTGGSIQLAATERGKPAAVLCKLEPVRAFEGKAKITLMGLPPKATCQPKEISATDREVVFEVTTEADTPVGQHKGLFCEVELSAGAEAVNHRFAWGGVLRVDDPPPAPAAPPPAAPEPAAAPAPPPAAEAPRPLSRLEQLRRKAQEEKQEGSPK